MALNGVYNEDGEPLGLEHVYEPDPNDMADWSHQDYDSSLDDWYGDKDDVEVVDFEEIITDPEPIRQTHSVFYPLGGSSS